MYSARARRSRPCSPAPGGAARGPRPPGRTGVYIYIYIYMHTYTYVYIYIYIHTYMIYIYIHIISLSICIYIYMYDMYVCIYLCLSPLSLSLYIYIYICIYTHAGEDGGAAEAAEAEPQPAPPVEAAAPCSGKSLSESVAVRRSSARKPASFVYTELSVSLNRYRLREVFVVMKLSVSLSCCFLLKAAGRPSRRGRRSWAPCTDRCPGLCYVMLSYLILC